MKRTKLRERKLPDYTRGEEIFNMVSHIVGGGFGVIALATCVIKAAIYGGALDIVGAAVYGVSMVVLYTMSSLYHGLKPLTAKMRESKWLGWGVFGGVWALAALGIVFNSIDLRKYRALSMVLYIVMGWCIIFTGPFAIRALTLPGFLWVLGGFVFLVMGFFGLNMAVFVIVTLVMVLVPTVYSYLLYRKGI